MSSRATAAVSAVSKPANRQTGGTLIAHHLLARADGGTDHRDNLITPCTSCHNSYEPTKRQGNRSHIARTVEDIVYDWCAHVVIARVTATPTAEAMQEV